MSTTVEPLPHLRFEIPEAARILRISRATLYERIREGLITPSRATNHWMSWAAMCVAKICLRITPERGCSSADRGAHIGYSFDESFLNRETRLTL
jgi:hypothetical protein